MTAVKSTQSPSMSTPISHEQRWGLICCCRMLYHLPLRTTSHSGSIDADYDAGRRCDLLIDRHIPYRHLIPKYGEGATAFGTLLQEIVACLGEVTATSTCLPDGNTLVVQQLPRAYFCLQTITVTSTAPWTRLRVFLDLAYPQGWFPRGYSSDSSSDSDQSPSSTNTDKEYAHALNLLGIAAAWTLLASVILQVCRSRRDCRSKEQAHLKGRAYMHAGDICYGDSSWFTRLPTTHARRLFSRYAGGCPTRVRLYKSVRVALDVVNLSHKPRSAEVQRATVATSDQTGVRRRRRQVCSGNTHVCIRVIGAVDGRGLRTAPDLVTMTMNYRRRICGRHAP